MQLNSNEIHVWMADLTIPWENYCEQFIALSADEMKRAEQYHFPLHQRRFSISRSILRHLLAMYLDLSTSDIDFNYNEYKKPYLKSFSQQVVQFNLSHSSDIVIYAMTLNHPIGIDIEKTKENFNDGVALRFFSKQENEALKKLSKDEQVNAFYRVWSRKEALVKAVGKGISHSLSTFSVSVFDIDESIHFEDKKWFLTPIAIRNGYQSALATTQTINNISCWNVFDHLSLLKL